MTAVYSKQGDVFFPSKKENMQLHDALPAGNYTVRAHPERGFFFEPIARFELPTKLYGDTLSNADRILNTFEDRSATTGVLLSGEKGSGKTLLAKQLALLFVARGYAVITVNQPMVGEGFNTLIANLTQPCMIFFDEFEKVYNEPERQEQLLTLLDGVFSGKKLFVLTVNDSFKVNTHMKNRPGRLFYSLQYEGLSDEFIQEYCNDQLKNQANTAGVRQVASMFHRFNFDMLKAMVEEMNRYNETAQQAMRMLNAKPASDESTAAFDIEVKLGDQPQMCHPQVWRGNPLASSELSIVLFKASPKIEAGLKDLEEQYGGNKDMIESFEVQEVLQKAKAQRVTLAFSSENIKLVDAETGNVVYVKDGYTIIYKKQKARRTGYEYMGAY